MINTSSKLIIEIKEDRFSIPLISVGGFGLNNNYYLVKDTDELKRFTKFLGYLGSEENEYPKVMVVYDKSTEQYSHKLHIFNDLQDIEIEFTFDELYVDW